VGCGFFLALVHDVAIEVAYIFQLLTPLLELVSFVARIDIINHKPTHLPSPSLRATTGSVERAIGLSIRKQCQVQKIINEYRPVQSSNPFQINTPVKNADQSISQHITQHLRVMSAKILRISPYRREINNVCTSAILGVSRTGVILGIGNEIWMWCMS
jgi:hypothetical protein